MKNIHDEIGIIFDRVAEEYYHLTKSRQNYLYNDFGIDCGTDYARHILDEIAFDKDGESIY